MTKQEKHERAWRNRSWQHFSMTRKGRMSWANWFGRPRSRQRVMLLRPLPAGIMNREF